MAVIKSKRGESSMQFLETAYNLQVHVIKMCVKFPKRYTFFVTNNIVDLATKCHMNVKSANTIYPQNGHELQLRKDYINAAICDLQNLISQLDIAKGLFEIETKRIVEAMSLVSDELKLLKALKKSDKERYKSYEASI